jgi:hypothetical protein
MGATADTYDTFKRGFLNRPQPVKTDDSGMSQTHRLETSRLSLERGNDEVITHLGDVG